MCLCRRVGEEALHIQWNLSKKDTPQKRTTSFTPYLNAGSHRYVQLQAELTNEDTTFKTSRYSETSVAYAIKRFHSIHVVISKEVHYVRLCIHVGGWERGIISFGNNAIAQCWFVLSHLTPHSRFPLQQKHSHTLTHIIVTHTYKLYYN